MRRLSSLIVLVPLAAGAFAAAPAPDPVPLGADRLLFDSNRTGNYELWSMGVDGSDPVQLTDDPRYDTWWPKLSPDRRRVVFTRTPKGVHDRDYSQTSLWAMNVDGTEVRELIPNGGYGWDLQGHPEWSPDGRQLVMFGGSQVNPQIHVTDSDGRDPRAVTERPGTNLDPAWTPDGRILFVGCPAAVCFDAQYEVYIVDVDGAELRRLTNDLSRDHDPYMSPDGSQIAWLRQVAQGWAIYIMNADGSDQRPLVSSAGVNSKPAWSLDSTEIFFHGTPLLRTNFSVFAVDVATGSRRELTDRPPIGFGRYDDEYPIHSSF